MGYTVTKYAIRLLVFAHIISLRATPTIGTITYEQQPTRLRVTNNYKETLWIQQMNIPKELETVRLQPGESYDYTIPAIRTEATRLWPKIGCDESGNNCTIGQSMAPCPKEGCQPPIDSKFEATWAAIDSPDKNPNAEQSTWYNASQVDGYTIPFTILAKGPDVGKYGCVSSDASGLDLSRCPSAEDVSGGDPKLSPYTALDLRVFDPKNPSVVIGCMAPCKKLNYPAPWGYGMDESQSPAVHMCCPTPVDKLETATCTWEQGCATSESCRSINPSVNKIPIEETQYVKALHTMAPSVYAYSYDDANGLHTCTARTKFELIFGIDGTAHIIQ